MTDNLNLSLSAARRFVQQAETNLQAAIQRLERAEREARNSIPPEPDAEVLLFSLNLNAASKGISYKFAALKAGNLWYTTGRAVQAHGVTWETLVKWVRDHHVGIYGVVMHDPATGAAVRIEPR